MDKEEFAIIEIQYHGGHHGNDLIDFYFSD
jgi:hypothetical protein